MAQTYHQLRRDERCQIHSLHRQGASARTIADQLHRHRSTIYRELRRNADPSGYCHQQAQTRSEQRRRQAASGPRKLHPPLWDRICDLLRMHWSPEQIAGRLRLAGDTSVSFSWLYRRIHQDRADGGQLHACLRQRGKRRRCRATKGSAGRGCIPGRTDISERPSIVEDKQRTGDWEGDTIIGKAHSGAVVTLVDRRSKYTLTQAVTNKTAALVGGAVQDLLAPFTPLVHTLTFDNGKEFAGHRTIATSLATAIFFARPYHSWERGLNEHTNGLLRQFVPKSENLRTLDPGILQDATDRLNHRPRKVLAYRTPHEVFSAACRAAGIAPPPAGPAPRPL